MRIHPHLGTIRSQKRGWAVGGRHVAGHRERGVRLAPCRRSESRARRCTARPGFRTRLDRRFALVGAGRNLSGLKAAWLTQDTFAWTSPLLSRPHIMRMSHGHYPCSEETHESPTNAPQTEQQERDHQTPSRQGRPVHHKVARIAGDEAHQEGHQVEDGSCKSACQEAEPSTDGYSANDQTDKKANEQAQCETEEFPCCQGKSRLDGQTIHRNLLARCMKGPRIDECDYHRQQGSDDTCNTTCN